MTTTQESLFPTSTIPHEVIRSLPSGYSIRPLERNDFAKGFLDCLRVLTHVGELSEADFHERYDDMQAAKGTYFVLVIEHESKIVATGALVVERKFIHNRGKCGHIEEVSVLKEYQGKGLGRTIIMAIDAVGRAVGCYKTILNCSPENEPFYSKCGYENSGLEMSHYNEEGKDSYHRG